MAAAARSCCGTCRRYVICSGNPAEPHGINTEGLKRRGFAAETINALRRAYRTLYKDGLTTAEAIDGARGAFRRASTDAAVPSHTLRDFVQNSQRGIVR